jgi:hypothetical protein
MSFPLGKEKYRTALAKCLAKMSEEAVDKHNISRICYPRAVAEKMNISKGVDVTDCIGLVVVLRNNKMSVSIARNTENLA